MEEVANEELLLREEKNAATHENSKKLEKEDAWETKKIYI